MQHNTTELSIEKYMYNNWNKKFKYSLLIGEVGNVLSSNCRNIRYTGT